MMVPNGHQDSVAVESLRESLRIDQTIIQSMTNPTQQDGDDDDKDVFRQPNSFLSMFGETKMHLALTLPSRNIHHHVLVAAEPTKEEWRSCPPPPHHHYQMPLFLKRH